MRTRLAQLSDYRQLAHICFICSQDQPEAFLHKLGRRFMEQYFWICLGDPLNVTVCALDTNDPCRIVGFVNGTLDVAASNRRLRRSALWLAMAVGPQMVRHPGLLWQVVSRYRAISRRDLTEQYMVGSGARGAYWAVLPEARGHATAFEVFKAWLTAMRDRGAGPIGLEVDYVNPRSWRAHTAMGAKIVRDISTPDGRRRLFFEYP